MIRLAPASYLGERLIPLIRSNTGWSIDCEEPTVSEIVLISLAVIAIAVALGAFVRRLGDLDDHSTMRDMVEGS